jgi:hypothetical protein
MLAKVIIENGVKKIQALTADTGTGAPVGSYLYLEKKSNPQGYLYCDGSTFDETVYPALYQYLGTNVLPDWRELGAKGAEKNTTLIFDSTETDPSTGQAGKQNHDVFTQGEFKDYQLQSHVHRIDSYNNGSTSFSTKVLYKTDTGLGNQNVTDTGLVFSARIGTTTRGKSRAVFIYIKATSGLTENQQENVLNTINENNSYSTEEHPTGKKWIDGKPIYRKVETVDNMAGIKDSWVSTGVTIPNVETLINVISLREGQSTRDYIGALNYEINNSMLNYYIVGDTFLGKYKLIIEYTKTTDN